MGLHSYLNKSSKNSFFSVQMWLSTVLPVSFEYLYLWILALTTSVVVRIKCLLSLYSNLFFKGYFKMWFESSQVQLLQSVEIYLFENCSCYSVPSVWNVFLLPLCIVIIFICGSLVLEMLAKNVCMTSRWRCELTTSNVSMKLQRMLSVRKADCGSYSGTHGNWVDEADHKEINSEKSSTKLILAIFQKRFHWDGKN